MKDAQSAEKKVAMKAVTLVGQMAAWLENWSVRLTAAMKEGCWAFRQAAKWG